MDRIIRILTAGKPLDAIDQKIAHAIQSGSRVPVKASDCATNFSESGPSLKLDSENSIIAKWSEGLFHEYGMIWQWVSPDVLFVKAIVQKLGTRV